MNNWASTSSRPAWASRPIAALLLLVQFLFLLVLAQSESLHRAVHADATTPSHHCAVTLLQTGQLETPGCSGPLLPPNLPPVVQAPVEFFPVLAVDRFLPPSCGPPALARLIVVRPVRLG